MPSDEALKAAREWLASGHHIAVKSTHREEFTDNLAALLDSFAAQENEACEKVAEAEKERRIGDADTALRKDQPNFWQRADSGAQSALAIASAIRARREE